MALAEGGRLDNVIDELIAVGCGGGGGLENVNDELIALAVAEGEDWIM